MFDMEGGVSRLFLWLFAEGSVACACGDHSVAMDRTTIYVGNVDSMLTEDELRAFFASCGEIVSVRLAGYGLRVFCWQ